MKKPNFFLIFTFVLIIFQLFKFGLTCDILHTKCQTENSEVEFLFQPNWTSKPDSSNEDGEIDFIIMTMRENGESSNKSHILSKNQFNIYRTIGSTFPFASIQIDISANFKDIKLNGHVNGFEIIDQCQTKHIMSKECNNSNLQLSQLNRVNTPKISPIPKILPALSIMEMNNPDLLRFVLEVLVIVDQTIAQYFHFDQQRIEYYVRVFYNSVNNRFRNIRDLKLTVVVTGVHFLYKWNDDKIKKNAYNETTNLYDGSKVLDQLSNYVKNNKKLPEHDVVQLLSAENYENENVVIDGLADFKAACLKFDGGNESVSLVKDVNGLFQGVETATHELAHLLGANHDGAGNNNCYKDGWHIMSSNLPYKTKQNFYFTNCSISEMKAYVNSEKGICLRTLQSSSFYSYPNILPGDMLSLDAQCKKYFNEKDLVFASESVADEQICTTLLCRTTTFPFEYKKTNVIPADNSRCGPDKVCLNGKCISKSEQVIWQYPNYYAYARPISSSGNNSLVNLFFPKSSIVIVLILLVF